LQLEGETLLCRANGRRLPWGSLEVTYEATLLAAELNFITSGTPISS